MAQIETGMVCGCEINGTDWENDLLANAPDWFDDDVSQSEIVTRYVRWLEGVAQAARKVAAQSQLNGWPLVEELRAVLWGGRGEV